MLLWTVINLNFKLILDWFSILLLNLNMTFFGQVWLCMLIIPVFRRPRPGNLWVWGYSSVHRGPCLKIKYPPKAVSTFQRLAHGFDIFTVIKLVSILGSPDLDASKEYLKLQRRKGKWYSFIISLKIKKPNFHEWSVLDDILKSFLYIK